MEILSFTIKGKLAHFRKYYANNTALSFSIPPRTTLMGIVASAMGWEKDSYYEKLSSENIRFGVRVLSPLKKSFHRLNFLSIKQIGDLSKSFETDFRGWGGRIQTPFEVVSGLDLRKDDVAYQVFIQPVGKDYIVFNEIKKKFLNDIPTYNISLGPANFQASLQNIELIQDSKIQSKSTDDFVHIHSAVPVSYIEELIFEKEESNQYNFVEEDMMPGEFVGNNNREVKKMNRLLFSTTKHPLRLKLTVPYLALQTKNEILNILYMD